MGSRIMFRSAGRNVSIASFKLQITIEGENKCRSHLKPSAKYFNKNSQESNAWHTPFGAIA